VGECATEHVYVCACIYACMRHLMSYRSRTSTAPLITTALDWRLLPSITCIPARCCSDDEALTLEAGVGVGVGATVGVAAVITVDGLSARIVLLRRFDGSSLCSPTPAPMSKRGITGNKKRSS
jgi:hypothetical protein